MVMSANAWNTALAGYEAAQAVERAMARLWELLAGPDNVAAREAVEEEWERATDLRDAAIDVLLVCPAPHAEACARKLSVIAARWSEDDVVELLAPVIADLERLGGR